MSTQSEQKLPQASISEKLGLTYGILFVAIISGLIGPVNLCKAIINFSAWFVEITAGNIALPFLFVSISLCTHLTVTIVEKNKFSNANIMPPLCLSWILNMLGNGFVLSIAFFDHPNIIFFMTIMSWTFVLLLCIWDKMNYILFNRPLDVTLGGIAVLVSFLLILTMVVSFRVTFDLEVSRVEAAFILNIVSAFFYVASIIFSLRGICVC